MRDDEPRFEAILNSNLDCKDCIYNNEEDDECVASCEKYDTKPVKVLDGEKCGLKIKK